MKRIVLFLLLIPFTAFGQYNEPQDIDIKRQQIVKQGLFTLGGWAAGNMIVGGVGMATSEGEAFRFHQMNFFWNTINFGIALPGYLVARKESPSNDFAEVRSRFRKAELSYTFNTALDLAYITAGFWLRERAAFSDDPTMMNGYGNSLILQGGFLFAYDLWALIRMGKLNKNGLNPMFDRMTLGYFPNGISIRLRLG